MCKSFVKEGLQGDSIRNSGSKREGSQAGGEFRLSRWSLQGALQWKSGLRFALLLKRRQGSRVFALHCPRNVEVGFKQNPCPQLLYNLVGETNLQNTYRQLEKWLPGDRGNLDPKEVLFSERFNIYMPCITPTHPKQRTTEQHKCG